MGCSGRQQVRRDPLPRLSGRCPLIQPFDRRDECHGPVLRKTGRQSGRQHTVQQGTWFDSRASQRDSRAGRRSRATGPAQHRLGRLPLRPLQCHAEPVTFPHDGDAPLDCGEREQAEMARASMRLCGRNCSTPDSHPARGLGQFARPTQWTPARGCEDRVAVLLLGHGQIREIPPGVLQEEDLLGTLDAGCPHLILPTRHAAMESQPPELRLPDAATS